MDNPQTFIFIGRSGSGKGTQIDLLKKYITKVSPDVKSYSFVMGDTFRLFMKDEGYAQNMVSNITSKGKLVPDIVTNSLFVSNLLSNLRPDQHLYIDGIPRSLSQAKAVIEILEFYSRPNPTVINIEVSEEEVKKRMVSRGRSDDAGEAIIERLNFYNKNVIPAIKYLKEESGFTYIEVNGERSIKEIHSDIIGQLNL